MNKKLIVIIAVFILLFAAGIIAVTQESEYIIDIPEENEFADDDGDINYDSETDYAYDADYNEIAEGYEDNEDNEEYEEYGEYTEYAEFIEFERIPPYSGYIYAMETPEWVHPPRWFRSNASGLVLEEVTSRLVALRNEYALSVDFIHQNDLPDEIFSYYDYEYFIELRTLYERGKKFKTQWIYRDISGQTRFTAVFSDTEEETGFMEIYDETGLITAEYLFLENDEKQRIDYEIKDGILISAIYNSYEDNEYKQSFIDYFQYNRALYLRAVERRFFRNGEIFFYDEPVRLMLPSSIEKAVEDSFSSARYNALPEYFGSSSFTKDDKLVYINDDKGRILSQALYNEQEELIWIIENTWDNDRIILSEKKEGGMVMTAEYEYDSSGNRISEKNYRNGILERVVEIDGTTEIEELYLDNVVVLRAFWEDGRKISETRVGNH